MEHGVNRNGLSLEDWLSMSGVSMATALVEFDGVMEAWEAGEDPRRWGDRDGGE